MPQERHLDLAEKIHPGDLGAVGRAGGWEGSSNRDEGVYRKWGFVLDESPLGLREGIYLYAPKREVKESHRVDHACKPAPLCKKVCGSLPALV